MPTVRDLRDRIRSMKNTQQITKAMKQVAAAKIRRADALRKQSRPYADALAKDGVVVMLPLPGGFKPSPMTMQMLWPEAQDAAPASKWIRSILVELTSTPT